MQIQLLSRQGNGIGVEIRQVSRRLQFDLAIVRGLHLVFALL
jgi:hypothetical protein